MVAECWQLRHWMWRAVAFEERVDAPMMMPGMRTRRETYVASRSRIVVWDAVEWRRSWCSGSGISRCEG